MKVLEGFVTETDGPIAGYHWWCPGCEMHHMFAIRVYRTGSNPVWEFNGNEEHPTVTPSIRTTLQDQPRKECHVFLTDGIIDFQGDSWHRLAGQKVPMVLIEQWDY